MNKTIAEFLTYLKTPVSEPYCERLIASHADFPSLLSIVDTLERLGIRHVVGKIAKEKIGDLSFPYILQLDKGQGDILPIKSAKDLSVNKNDLEYWNGIVIQIEPTESILDKENNRLYSKEKFFKAVKIVFLSAVAGMILWSLSYSVSALPILLLITAIAGLVVGYFLVAKDLGVTYKVVEDFCTSGKNTNCDEILTSDEATLFGEIKLSDSVLVYFIFQVFFLTASIVLAAFSPTILLSLAMGSFLIVPIVFYSVYYQYVKAKSWCRLCLVVDGILMLQTALFSYLIVRSTNWVTSVSYELIILEATALVAITCGALLFKRALAQSNDLEKLIHGNARIKNNARVFGILLKQQLSVNTSLMEHEVLIGSADAPIKIVMVTNLFCNPCKEQHESIDQLINTFPDKVNLALRFMPSRGNEANHYVLQYWYRFIHLKNDESTNTLNLMHEWYALMDLEKFKKRFPMELQKDVAISDEIESRHAKWIENLGINRTPTVFINGYELPQSYQLKDILSLIPGLTDEAKASVPIEKHNAFITA